MGRVAYVEFDESDRLTQVWVLRDGVVHFVPAMCLPRVIDGSIDPRKHAFVFPLQRVSGEGVNWSEG